MNAASNFTSKLNELYEKAGGKGSPFVRNLAAKTGVTPRTIHKLLEGSEPGLDLALKIAGDLGFSLESGEERAKTGPDPDFEAFKKAALTALINATDAQWRAVRPALSALLPPVKNQKAAR